jgi:hypothetical protein
MFVYRNHGKVPAKTTMWRTLVGLGGSWSWKQEEIWNRVCGAARWGGGIAVGIEV